MARVSLPPGFRFHPTDVELVQGYLKRKIMGWPIPNAISEIDVYKFAPWDLPDKSRLQSRDSEWYFFYQRHKKYASGGRMNRTNEVGYWKSTGKDKPVSQNSKTVGMKKILVFYIGRAPRGDKTDWVMHEFRLGGKDLDDKFFLQDEYVLCRICKKSGPGQNNGEQHGDSSDEDDWDDDILNSLGFLPVADPFPQPILPAKNLNILPVTSPCNPGSSSGSLLESIPLQIASSHASGELPLFSEEDITLLLAIFGNNEASSSSISNNCNMEKLDSVVFYDNTIEAPNFSDDRGIYNGLEDLDTQGELDMIDKFHFTSSVEDEYPLYGTLLGDDASCSESNKLDCLLRDDLLDLNAMKLDDLDLPLEYTAQELNAMKLDDLDCPLEYPDREPIHCKALNQSLDKDKTQVSTIKDKLTRL